MANTNSTNLTNCNSCNYCYYCNSCDYCDSCNSCDYCNYCYYCYYCNSCDYCNSCNSCDYCNYCYYSANLKMSERMLFCLGNADNRSQGDGYQRNNCIFNVQVSEEEWNEAKDSLPTIRISHTYWVDKKDMTKDEKSNNSVYKKTGGYLKTIPYKEAWANWWEDASKKDKQAILDLPHFDAEIFKGITGIDVKYPSNPKEITIDKAIKTVILEALKAEMPNKIDNTKDIRAIWDDTDFAVDWRLGYNRAIDDCLNVCNKLLGDSNE